MAETNPDQPVGNWHYEWREISNPYADFNQTKLYELIANLFSQKGHTHQKSDITDFAHTHKANYAKIDANGIQLYVNDDVGIATLRIYETGKDFGSGTGAWYLTTNGNITQNSQPVVIPEGYRPLTSSVVLHTFGQSGMTGIVHTDGTISFLRGSTTGSQNIHAYGTWLF